MHGATVIRTIGLVSPRSPSFDAVEKAARKSAVPYSRGDMGYVPAVDDGGKVTRFVHVVDPIARRCSRTVRPPIGLALKRP